MVTSVIHHNWLIVDDELVATGNYNYTWSAADLNDEDLYITLDIYTIQTLRHLYQSFWEGTW
jgi:phosphatidylserine/phosphatidylglycerophosphate/cardiolipin synthase-like enzyme